MPPAPVVETARLTLRPPVAGDRDAWVALHRDPRTYWHAPHAMAESDEAAEEFFEATRQHWDDRGFGVWVASSHGSGDVVGVCGLREVDRDAHFLNLYYRLGFEHQGHGLGKEMSRTSAAHAVEFLPRLSVRALVKEVNTPSVRTALGAGLERVGTRVLHDDLPDEPPSTVFEAPSAEAVGSFDEATREQILDLWVRTNDAGGAVGFTAGASRADVDARLSAAESEMESGMRVAVVQRSAADERVLGLAFLSEGPNPLLSHTRWVYTVMTDPAARGRNLGRLLMAGTHRVARKLGVEILSLGVRSGTGTSRFYEACGYHESGRVLGAIRVAPGDERDDITMTRRLDDRVLRPDPRN
ncbi:MULTISPECIES: GNAT family N-acetyltransferase [unclassified Knoellia]|uniref:GNAT family N-acetyltransferase n=1 Tax=Knoellia altitudinis TaxID=3404795 RepID=UPI00360DA8B4